MSLENSKSDQSNPIYLDYASTTPVDPAALEEFVKVSSNFIGNPHSRTHFFGMSSEKIVEKSREVIAETINARPDEIVFTSGATESANIGILGIAKFNFEPGKKDHIITCMAEHKCVIEPHRHLKSLGFNVTLIKTKSDGLIDMDDLKSSITDKTIMISIMHVNNETGVIQNVKEIGKIAKERKVLFFCDAAQSFGKIKIDVEDMNIDCMGLSGHKIYSPKGIGAIYCRKKPRLKLQPILFGGDQERGIRSGTLSPALCASFAKAIQMANSKMDEDSAKMHKFSKKLQDEILCIDEVFMNGSKTSKVPNINNFTFRFIEGESLIMSIPNFAVSSGSACTSKQLETSHVLTAMGLTEDMAHSSIRISFGRFTTENEIDSFINEIKEQIVKLREMSPLWEMHKDGIDISAVEWTHKH